MIFIKKSISKAHPKVPKIDNILNIAYELRTNISKNSLDWNIDKLFSTNS